MPNQTEIKTVLENVIEPMKRLWGAEFDTDTIDIFVEDLKDFTASEMQNAMKKLRRECKRKPTLAQVYGTCREYAPALKTNSYIPDHRAFYCLGYAEAQHPGNAMEILESPIGQIALKQGVARELLVEYENSGRKEFDEVFIRKSKNSLMDSITALRECEASGNKEYIHFLGIFNQSQEREKRLYEKYYKATA